MRTPAVQHGFVGALNLQDLDLHTGLAIGPVAAQSGEKP